MAASPGGIAPFHISAEPARRIFRCRLFDDGVKTVKALVQTPAGIFDSIEYAVQNLFTVLLRVYAVQRLAGRSRDGFFSASIKVIFEEKGGAIAAAVWDGSVMIRILYLRDGCSRVNLHSKKKLKTVEKAMDRWFTGKCRGTGTEISHLKKADAHWFVVRRGGVFAGKHWSIRKRRIVTPASRLSRGLSTSVAGGILTGDVAFRADMHSTTISLYERGERQPSIHGFYSGAGT